MLECIDHNNFCTSLEWKWEDFVLLCFFVFKCVYPTKVDYMKIYGKKIKMWKEGTMLKIQSGLDLHVVLKVFNVLMGSWLPITSYIVRNGCPKIYSLAKDWM